MSATEPWHIVLPDTGATMRMAAWLAAQVRAGDCIALSGEVGAGKTTFAQSFAGAVLADPVSVTSPTYTIMQTYDTKHGWPLLHADLYRLRHADELRELGLEELLASHVTLIEWPEIAMHLLPADTLCLELEYGSDTSRVLKINHPAPRWTGLWAEVPL